MQMRIHALFACGVLPLFFTSIAAHADADRLPKEVDALAWEVRALERGGRMLFPEQLPEAPVPADWNNRRSFGIVFSGGGVRSAAATLGQLRALNLLGWYDRAKYVSSVSGGTWGSIPFTFLPTASDEDEKRFLGPYRDPAELRDDDLQARWSGDFAQTLSGVKVYRNALRGWGSLEGDETFASVLGKAFLAPHGLDGDRSFAWTAKQVEGIVARNSACNPPLTWNARKALPRVPCLPGEHAESALSSADFIVPAKPRPLHIVGSVLVLQRGFLQWMTLPPEWLKPVDITPYYTGTREAHQHVFAGTGATLNVGGLYVESFAYDTKRPLPVERLAPDTEIPTVYRSERKAGLSTRFRLRDVLATSGVAPQQGASALGFRNLGFPEVRHWAIDDGGVVTSREIAHGDGGHIDNIGLIPLLARGVRNIVVFINTPHAFTLERDKSSKIARDERKVKPFETSMDEDLVSYFDPKSRNYVIEKSRGCASRPECKGPLDDLYKHFAAQLFDGQPLVFCDEYTIKPRSPEQPRTPQVTPPTNICWLYLNAPAAWKAEVKKSAVSEITKFELEYGKEAWRRFPNYATFFPNFPDEVEIIDYSEEQISALAHLTAWTMCRSAEYLAGSLDADLQLGRVCKR